MRFRIGLSIFLLVISMISASQDFNLKDLKKFYKNQKDSSQLYVYQNSGTDLKQIFLIRHGEPDLDKKGWRKRDEAIQFMLDYDSALVVPFLEGPLNIASIPVDTIFHSSLPRARNTAQLAFPENFILVEDSSYREFERKAMKWCKVKMPTKFWTKE